MYHLSIGDINGNNEILYYPADSELTAYDIELSLSVGACGELNFKIPANNPLYSKIEQYKIITVYNNDVEIWRGWVKEVTASFNKTLSVYCLEDLGWLNYEFSEAVQLKGNRTQLFQNTLAEYNAKSGITGTEKAFVAGYVSTDANITVEVNYETNFLERLRLIAGDDLYIRVRRVTVNGNVTRYIDIVNIQNYGNANSQYISFGENLLDFTKELNTSYMLNVIYPYGAEIEGEEVYEGCTKRIKGTTYTDEAKIAIYGRIAKNVLFDTSNTDTLNTQAQQYLQRNALPRLKIQVTALDLANLDSNIDSYDLGDSVRIIAEPFGYGSPDDSVLYITDLTLNLQKLENNKLTISTSVTGKTSLTSQTANIIEEAKVNLPSTSSILASAKANAIAMLEGANGGYLNFIFDEDRNPTGFTITDFYNPDEATRKWIWNENGLGFMKLENGSWVLKNAITPDGKIVADLITAGTMQADRIKGGTLSLGGSGNGNGVLTVNDASGIKVVGADSDGLFAKKGYIGNGSLGFTITDTSITNNVDGIFDVSNAGACYAVNGMRVNAGGKTTYIAGNSIYTSGTISCNGTFSCNGDANIGNGSGTNKINGLTYFELGTIYSIQVNPNSLTNPFFHFSSGEYDNRYMSWSGASDRRIKKDIENIDEATVRKFFKDIKPVKFKYKDDDTKQEYGLIAQELEEVFADMGVENAAACGEIPNDEHIKYIEYVKLTGLQLKAIQDLYNIVEKQQEEINELKARL